MVNKDVFDYKGYSREKLLLLAGDKVRVLPSSWRPWIVELYSYGRLLRQYGFFPQWLPIYVYHIHGPGFATGLHEHEALSGAYCLFVNNSVDVDFLHAGLPRCKVMLNPFVFFRKSNKIQRDRDAKGTLVFPAHSTLYTKKQTDVDAYIKQLRVLPEEFKSIAICLHYIDVNRGAHEKYIKAGFPVYTARNGNDVRYVDVDVDRFYEILRHCRYTTSNTYMAMKQSSTTMVILD